jgi:hypothetical protein
MPIFPFPLIRLFATLLQFAWLVEYWQGRRSPPISWAAGELSCDPSRRVGLWSRRLEQDGPLRQASRIAEFASERLAQSVGNLNKTWIIRISVFCSRRCVAKQCRSV